MLLIDFIDSLDNISSLVRLYHHNRLLVEEPIESFRETMWLYDYDIIHWNFGLVNNALVLTITV